MFKRVNRVFSAWIVAGLFGGGAILEVTGNASTADQILSFLSPSARAFIMADSTWNLLAAAAFAWLAFELQRDAGIGNRALKDAIAANERAWAFSAEMAAYRNSIDAAVSTNLVKINQISLRIDQALEELHQFRLLKQDVIDEVKHVAVEQGVVAFNEAFEIFKNTAHNQLRDMARGWASVESQAMQAKLAQMISMELVAFRRTKDEEIDRAIASMNRRLSQSGIEPETPP